MSVLMVLLYTNQEFISLLSLQQYDPIFAPLKTKRKPLKLAHKIFTFQSALKMCNSVHSRTIYLTACFFAQLPNFQNSMCWYVFADYGHLETQCYKLKNMKYGQCTSTKITLLLVMLIFYLIVQYYSQNFFSYSLIKFNLIG